MTARWYSCAMRTDRMSSTITMATMGPRAPIVVVLSRWGEGRESGIVAGLVKGAAAGNPEELHLEFF